MAKKFNYKLRSASGQAIEGVLDANTLEAAIQELKNRYGAGARVIDVKPASALQGDLQLFERSPNGTDMSLFCAQFALMARSRVSQSDTLYALMRTSNNRKLKTTLGDIREQVQAGTILNAAMRKHPEIFDKSFIALLTAGIRTDTLSSTLDRLSEMYERNVKTEQEVKGALIQPAITLIVAVGVILLLSVMVIPQFKSMLSGLNVPLPIYTKVLISTSDFLRSWGVIIPLSIFAGLIYSFRNYRKTEAGRVKTDELLLKIPKIGQLILLSSLSRVNRTLATLLSNGIPKSEAIEISAQASGNALIEEVLMEGKKNIERGGLLFEVLERYPKLFPATITGMVSTGEKQGELAQMLDRVSDFFERQVESEAKNITRVIEPMMFIFIAIVVGGIVLAIMTPLASMVQQLSK